MANQGLIRLLPSPFAPPFRLVTIVSSGPFDRLAVAALTLYPSRAGVQDAAATL